MTMMMEMIGDALAVLIAALVGLLEIIDPQRVADALARQMEPAHARD